MQLNQQFIKQIPPQIEWRYLVGETLIGERMIVGALTKLVADLSIPSDFRLLLEEQLNEEAHHLNQYSKILGSKNVVGSGFDRSLTTFVKQLPLKTQKLYALQGLLEGVSLGALKHRMDHWQDSTSIDFDHEVYQDEKKHVSLSFGYFDQLAAQEGVLKRSDFQKIDKEIKFIFNQAFNSETIAQVIDQDFKTKIDKTKIEHDEVYKNFQDMSRHEILENRDKFIECYYENINC